MNPPLVTELRYVEFEPETEYVPCEKDGSRPRGSLAQLVLSAPGTELVQFVDQYKLLVADKLNSIGKVKLPFPEPVLI